MNAAEGFREAIASAGLTPPDFIEADGELHRFASNGQRSDDAGWYVLHLDGVPSGAFGCWRAGITQSWCARNRRELTAAERSEQARRTRAARDKQRRDKELRHAECRDRAAAKWERLPAADPWHPYLSRKQIQPHGVRQDGDRLVIPVADIKGRLHGLQFIAPDGTKLFMLGTNKTGQFHLIGDPGAKLVIAEGFATAASIHEATGLAVAVAFDKGNLLPVAQVLQGVFPDTRIIIVGDNDLDGGGQAKAKAAAAAVCGVALIPEPIPGSPDPDWNDIACRVGADAVAQAFAVRLEPEPEPWRVAVARLATLPPMEYDQRRDAEAKRLGARVGTLDDEVKKARGEARSESGSGSGSGGRAVELFEPEPWPEPVDGAELLSELAAAFARHLVLPPGAADALALWTVHAHAHDTAIHSPILGITSPAPGCGKTTLLTALGALVPRPLPASNITAAAVFRAIDKWRPTLLVDEADTFLKDNDDLRGVFNSGHARATAFVIRTVGEDHEPRQFGTWAPKAVALIGKLPATLADRAILIELRRKTPHERIEPLRDDRTGHLDVLARKAARWVADHEAALRAADPAMPRALVSRTADNWRHMLAVADQAGGEWPERARRAAERLAATDSSQTAAITLLADLRDLFAERSRITSKELVSELSNMLDRPWPEWGRQAKPISENQVAGLLRGFRIFPKDLRTEAGTRKGYERPQFTEAFACYLPDGTATPRQANGFSGLAPAPSATLVPPVADRDDANLLESHNCRGVADRNAGTWEMEL